jgi:uncharacterized membrane protein
MNKNRLEAFSDGVIAIIITIMVLELKMPHSTEWSALRELIPVFISYILSFAYIGIYWNNHHHLIHATKHISGGIMWANLNLLFWLSLVPFATAWMGENHFDKNTVVLYAILLLVCGTAYNILQRTITSCHKLDETLKQALERTRIKGNISLISYLASIAIAFYSPFISCIIFVLVAIAWLMPDKNIERAIKE